MIRKRYLDTCYNPNFEAYRCDNLQPIHKSDLQSHKPRGYSWHTHSPVWLTRLKKK
ncbi:hypothetical protein HanRHA438_Chr05g0245711 [Helianthus annuus]|nr:hypothetical protein HanRHA438_Chr05g0245711 [Helianthus annuus]